MRFTDDVRRDPLISTPLAKLVEDWSDEEVTDGAYDRQMADYHRTLRTKNMLTSVLDEIEGIGSVKRNSLLAYFGSIDSIKAATAEELVKVDGITEKNAQNILKYFRG